MKAPLLRPTFNVPLNLPRKRAAEEIRTRLLARDDLAGRWRSKGRWVDLYVDERDRRIWSPYLSARLDEDGDSCSVFARFAPHPEVWTFFMFLYFLVAFIILFGGTFGYVQWASQEPAWAMWAVWGGLPVLAVIHVASYVGSRLGQEQMHELKGILVDVVSGLEA
jgi:hypothetical protein